MVNKPGALASPQPTKAITNQTASVPIKTAILIPTSCTVIMPDLVLYNTTDPPRDFIIPSQISSVLTTVNILIMHDLIMHNLR